MHWNWNTTFEISRRDPGGKGGWTATIYYYFDMHSILEPLRLIHPVRLPSALPAQPPPAGFGAWVAVSAWEGRYDGELEQDGAHVTLSHDASHDMQGWCATSRAFLFSGGRWLRRDADLRLADSNN